MFLYTQLTAIYCYVCSSGHILTRTYMLKIESVCQIGVITKIIKAKKPLCDSVVYWHWIGRFLIS